MAIILKPFGALVIEWGATMTKKISKAIVLVSCLTLLCALVFIVGSFYNYSEEIQLQNQQANLDMVAVGVSQNGMEYLNALHADNYRVTWIDSDGTVLFDSQANSQTMENHADREEFKQALLGQTGKATRTSSTLAQETIYMAKMLDDGTVIRTATTQRTIFSLIISMLAILLFIVALAAVISIMLASNIAKKTVAPINSLNLDDPLSNDVYEEINPLLHRIEGQNNEIREKISKIKGQQKELSLITENVADGIVILDDSGIVIMCNKVAKTLLSCEIGNYYLSFFRDIEYEKLIENALLGSAGKVKLQIENEHFVFSASPIKANEGYSIFLFIHNITEDEQAHELRRQFSANVSHELKTPLTSIMGASELLKSGMVKKEDVKDFATNIHSEATRLLTLVQDIINLSRLDEQSNFEFVNIDIAAVTNEVVNHLSNKAKSKGISVKFSAKQTNIHAVPTVLYEMIYNLCDNAIVYNKTDGKIFVEILQNDDKIVFSIRDTGVGIDKEHLPRIFERFYRVDKSHSKETGGTGLGLSIVKNGANLHKAQLLVESTLGEGTLVTITFFNNTKV